MTDSFLANSFLKGNIEVTHATEEHIQKIVSSDTNIHIGDSLQIELNISDEIRAGLVRDVAQTFHNVLERAWMTASDSTILFDKARINADDNLVLKYVQKDNLGNLNREMLGLFFPYSQTLIDVCNDALDENTPEEEREELYKLIKTVPLAVLLVDDEYRIVPKIEAMTPADAFVRRSGAGQLQGIETFINAVWEKYLSFTDLSNVNVLKDMPRTDTTDFVTGLIKYSYNLASGPLLSMNLKMKMYSNDAFSAGEIEELDAVFEALEQNYGAILQLDGNVDSIIDTLNNLIGKDIVELSVAGNTATRGLGKYLFDLFRNPLANPISFSVLGIQTLKALRKRYNEQLNPPTEQ